MQAVIGAKAEEQDNTSMLVLKLLKDEALPTRPSFESVETDMGGKPPASRFPDDPNVEEASDLLNQALLL